MVLFSCLTMVKIPQANNIVHVGGMESSIDCPMDFTERARHCFKTLRPSLEMLK